ncbi:RNAse (barnase) inhibitor barstar [Sphingomonas sp. SORGH_AS802]|uniref:barstar family protein n=1 Tax=unclassified Sphingomonas TaxID=196159 RepID=UPI0028599423|nr:MULTISPECIES: barstar family protein [unclassified Sphingomonas]MDR6125342.1 RNAse (barnase) inhibitor barstar [Sphingomonas sp. SORGH_AS_0438]MDR6133960.1 RNAse (barnase) inhibitor barstar [Sphingomonas sp. SORGH_AS_0802]
MDLTIDGATVIDEADFHARIRAASGVDWYGGSLDALFDLLVAVIEPPIALHLTHAAAARRAVGARFDRILTVIFDAIAERPAGAITLMLES